VAEVERRGLADVVTVSADDHQMVLARPSVDELSVALPGLETLELGEVVEVIVADLVEVSLSGGCACRPKEFAEVVAEDCMALLERGCTVTVKSGTRLGFFPVRLTVGGRSWYYGGRGPIWEPSDPLYVASFRHFLPPAARRRMCHHLALEKDQMVPRPTFVSSAHPPAKFGRVRRRLPGCLHPTSTSGSQLLGGLGQELPGATT
jgi:hypothetical protein